MIEVRKPTSRSQETQGITRPGKRESSDAPAYEVYKETIAYRKRTSATHGPGHITPVAARAGEESEGTVLCRWSWPVHPALSQRADCSSDPAVSSRGCPTRVRVRGSRETADDVWEASEDAGPLRQAESVPGPRGGSGTRSKAGRELVRRIVRSE